MTVEVTLQVEGQTTVTLRVQVSQAEADELQADIKRAIAKSLATPAA